MAARVAWAKAAPCATWRAVDLPSSGVRSSSVDFRA
jgi:hypothetical protein